MLPSIHREEASQSIIQEWTDKRRGTKCQSITYDRKAGKEQWRRTAIRMANGEFLQHQTMPITSRYGSVLEGDRGLCKATLGQSTVKIIGLTCMDFISQVLRDKCS